jgi:hypothetical protein
VIAMVADGDALRRGPLPVALARAGFERRDTSTTDQADCAALLHGTEHCVLIVDAASLAQRAGSATWARFLACHPSLAAVIVARGPADAEARAQANGPHRILLEDPADATAVTSAAQRACNARRPKLLRTG